MWPWHTVLASAVGAAIPLIPVYIFGFRQIVASKEATIEQLKGRIEQLKAECAPTVISEKRTLIDDIEARAKESAEAEETMRRAIKTVQDCAAALKAMDSQVLETTAKASAIPELVKKRTSTGSQLGVLMGVKSLIKVRYWWHGLALDMTEPIAKKLDVFIEQEVSNLLELRSRICDVHVLTAEEIAFAQEEMNRLRDQARAERKE
jgi:hypothetical protein